MLMCVSSWCSEIAPSMQMVRNYREELMGMLRELNGVTGTGYFIVSGRKGQIKLLFDSNCKT